MTRVIPGPGENDHRCVLVDGKCDSGRWEGTMVQCPECHQWWYWGDNGAWGNSWFDVRWWMWRKRNRIKTYIKEKHDRRDRP